jgi:type 1 glutamine amidotransferase/sugar phosphate isomerase/epimerase
VTASTFRVGTFPEAVERAAALRLKQIEADAGQLNWTLPPAEIAQVREKLRAAGVSMASYRVDNLPGTEAQARRLFAFARELGVETIVTERRGAGLDILERLCNEFRVNLAIRGDPRGVLDACARRGPRIGACGDVGAWIRSGIKPVDAVQTLGKRLLVVRVHDLDRFSRDGKDVAWGAGVAGLAELFEEVYKQELQPLWIVDHADAADAAKSVAFFERTAAPIAQYHRDYASRTQGIRRMGGVSAEERQSIERALPAQAPAKPKKARKLLVIDLNVGRRGHPSIPYANLAVALMGKKTGAYEAVVNNDASLLTPASLHQFDAVFLNNTIGNVFPTPEAKKAFADYIASGGGLVANHAVTVTNTDWEEFGEILGARGAYHRTSDEKVTVRVDDPSSPITAALGASFEYADEFFRFEKPYARDRLRVLLSIDVAKTDLNQGKCAGKCVRDDNDYAVAWIRRHGQGRVFYSTLGHNPYVFWDARILRHFLAAIQFALGDLEADTASLAQST